MANLSSQSTGLGAAEGGLQIKQKIRQQTIFSVGIVYLALLVIACSLGGIGVFLLVYVIFSIFAGKNLLEKDIAASSKEDSRFKKTLPLKKHGVSLASFEYLFFSSDDLFEELRKEINLRIRNSTIFSELRPIHFTDCDKRLLTPEKRDFYLSSANGTRHGTEMSLVLYTQSQGDARFVHWWVLARGFVDPDSVLKLLATSPIGLPFWAFANWRDELDLASKTRNIYDSFYSTLDYTTLARHLHFVAFEALVQILDRHGIDTSDLKAQRAQVMNFNISGGQTQFGNVVQAFKNATMAPQSTSKQ